MGHPTVEVTLLFTDIEGSTALAHELGDDYVELLAQHNRIIRDAIGHHVGVEARNEGDAFFAAFDRAADAVQAALDAQRALAAHAWASGRPVRVRMGLHTGPVIRLLHDFAGLNVHLASRISGAAHGGQVVASQAVLDALDTDAYEWTELGAHIVKDFPEPIRLFQLRADGLETKFPPLVTIDARDHNLPAMVTSFVGRQDELTDLRTLLLGDARLVTITGPGGAGKTRLSIEATWSVLSRFRGGAWFVDFAPVDDPNDIVDTIADALGVRERDGATRRDLVAEKLNRAPALLLLDNLEHLLSGVVAVSELLAACPALVVLATSRERLRLQGEHEVALDGLGDADASDLFAVRAAAVRRDVTVDERVAELCRRVGGLPLAIELAAARVRTHTVDALLGAMDSMLDTLSEGERDRPPRHQAMRAAIAMSVDALSEAERSVFRGFAVFAGGATHEAIDAVCSPKADEVQSLVDKSLLRATEERFTMLEPIRQFADERLATEVPGEREQRVQRHAEHFLAVAERLEPDLVTRRQREALDQLSADHANLRLALHRGRGDLPLILAGCLIRFWIYRGHPHEGRDVLTSVLAAAEHADPKVRAKALLGAGQLAVLQNDVDMARDALRQAAELDRDPATLALAANLLGDADRVSGALDDADRRFVEAAAFAEKAGSPHLLALIRNNEGVAAFVRGDFERAADLWREAFAIAEEVGDEPTMARALNNLGSSLRDLGRAEEATHAYERALELARANRDRAAEALASFNLALSLADASPDNEAVAAQFATSAIAIFEELGYQRQLADSLLAMPRFVDDLALALRSVARARSIFGEINDGEGLARAEAMHEMLLDF